jgi:hypothetical protein
MKSYDVTFTVKGASEPRTVAASADSEAGAAQRVRDMLHDGGQTDVKILECALREPTPAQ